MKKFFAFVIIMLLSAGCKKHQDAFLPEGEYKGTFTRAAPNENTISSNVTLSMSANTFSGTSDITNYPAICSGTLSGNSTKITVTNSCIFTANFDWSFIFNGEYFYQVNGKQLLIWKAYQNGKTDSYILEKK